MEISRCVSQHVRGGWLGGGVRRRLSVSPIEYSDKGHMRYYCISSNKYDYNKCCLKMKKKKKKKIEEEEEEEGALRRKVKVKSLMEVERLEQMRAEEKQQKRMRKRVKRMTMEDDTDSSSSSSSSSSEDDERKTTTAARIGDESAAALLRLPLMQQPMAEAIEAEASMAMASAVSVCVGNKCKKMGAESLLAELQQSTEMVVVPCKCMGKCKSAPNVKLLRADDDDALFTHVNLNNLSSILHKQCQLLLPA